MDFALLVDGLAAEREQGITIDVAYRFFSTERRKLHRCGHTRSRTVHTQHGHGRVHRGSRRHPGRCPQGNPHANPPAQPTWSRLLGIRQRRAGGEQDGPRRLGFGRRVRRNIQSPSTAEFARADRPRCRHVHPRVGAWPATTSLPAARTPRPGMPTPGPCWRHLETVRTQRRGCRVTAAFRMPVQWVNRPSAGVSWLRRASIVQRQRCARGDAPARVSPSGRREHAWHGFSWAPTTCDLRRVAAGQSVTLTLRRRDRRELARRRAVRPPMRRRPNPPINSRRTIVWMNDEPLRAGSRATCMKIGTHATGHRHGRRAMQVPP